MTSAVRARAFQNGHCAQEKALKCEAHRGNQSRQKAHARVCVREKESGYPPQSFAGDLNFVFCSLKMKKFNIRKVLDGLKEASSSTPSVQVGPQENHLIQETLQSEHFQLCKVGETGDFCQALSYSCFQWLQLALLCAFV